MRSIWKKQKPRVLAACGAALLGALLSAPSQARSQLTSTRYNGFAAFRLGDGKTEAVIVPQLNRVMRYGEVGGRNWLWNNARTTWKKDEWRNWGGEKTWLAPQSQWPLIGGRGWPPDAALDASPAAAEVASDKLITKTPISPFSGARVVREYSLLPDGDFLVRQTIEKLHGAPLYLSAWSVTQIAPPDAIFLPLNANSPYKNNFLWLAPPQPDVLGSRSATLLEAHSTSEKNFKIGVDAPVSAIAALRDGTLLTIRTPKPGGDYPDGALGAGLPVELWNNGDANAFYNEMELLSPLRLMYAGTRFTHSMKWRLQRIQPDAKITDATREKVEAALNAPF